MFNNPGEEVEMTSPQCPWNFPCSHTLFLPSGNSETLFIILFLSSIISSPVYVSLNNLYSANLF